MGILQRRPADVVACMAEQDEAALAARPDSNRQVHCNIHAKENKACLLPTFSQQ